MLNVPPHFCLSAGSSLFYSLRLPNCSSQGPGMPQTQMLILRAFGAAILLENMSKEKILRSEGLPLKHF